jgi:hypothetical protein
MYEKLQNELKRVRAVQSCTKMFRLYKPSLFKNKHTLEQNKITRYNTKKSTINQYIIFLNISTLFGEQLLVERRFGAVRGATLWGETFGVETVRGAMVQGADDRGGTVDDCVVGAIVTVDAVWAATRTPSKVWMIPIRPTL